MWKLTKTGRGYKPLLDHSSRAVPGLEKVRSNRLVTTRAVALVAAAFRLRARRQSHQTGVARSAQRQNLTAAARPPRHLDAATRRQMLDAMPGWRFDQRSKTFVARDAAPERFEELLDAVTDLHSEPVVLRVCSLSGPEAARVRQYLQTGSLLITLDHRMCEPIFL